MPDQPHACICVSTTQVTNLLALYAERIDAGDFVGIGELFAHAAVTVEGSDARYEGAAAVQGSYDTWTRKFPDDGTPHTKHVTTNLFVEVDDEAGTAATRSYVTVFQTTDDVPLQPILQGRYHDRFERVDGTWRFAHRHIFNDRTGNLSDHLLLDIADA